MRATIGMFEQAVLLAVLRLGPKAYGRTIHDELEKRLGKDVAMGAMYLTLERLHEKGFLTSTWGERLATRGGRARRYYKLEADGARALDEARTAIKGLWKGIRLPEVSA